MIYFANRATIMQFYHSPELRDGLAWLIGEGAVYVIRGDGDRFQWILDLDKLDDSSQCPPLAEIITRCIIAESEDERVKPIRTERTRTGIDRC